MRRWDAVQFVLLSLLAMSVLVLGWAWSPVGHLTPQMAIRATIVRDAGPIAAFTASVRRTGYVDSVYGYQSTVRGWTDPRSGNEVSFCYTQRGPRGLWYVTSCGSGP